MLRDATVILLMGALAVLLPLSATYRAHLRDRLAATAAATVPAQQQADLEMRITRRARSAGVGILVAGLLTLLLGWIWDGANEAAGGFFVLSVMFVAGAAGLALADIRWPGAPADGPRTARATSPSLSDYVPRQVLVVGQIFAAIGLLSLIVTLLLTRSVWFDAATIWHSPVPLLTATLPVLLVFSWLATRRVLDAPQPARDEVELYWQDAVRAQTLNSLSVTTPLVALFALIVCGGILDDAASAAAIAAGEVGPQWSLWLLVAGYLVPVVLLVGAVAVLIARHGRWNEMAQFQDRLWGGQPPRTHAEGVHS